MTMILPAKQIAAGEFKARCLRVLDEVALSGEEVVVTKRGKPVARLVPIASPTANKRRKPPASLKGTVLKYERPTDPTFGMWK